MNRTPSGRSPRLVILLGMVLAVAWPLSARANKLTWLDEVVHAAIREAEHGSESVARTEARSTTHTAERLFVRETDESLETIARRADDLARAAGRFDQPAEAALHTRFSRLIDSDAEMARTFAGLQPAEKRLVVEMGETAQRLARRYPGEAEPMIRKLGTEGMSAVRVYGDDVAEVIAKEGTESIGVLRKTGRGGWKFFTEKVLPNKGKLAAAGVVALFLANPDKFVDTAGQATQYAVEQFARAGIQLAGAVGSGAAKGIESAVGQTLAKYGLNTELTRKLGMIGAAVIAFLAVMVLIGLPIRLVLKPFTWPVRMLRRSFKTVRT